MKRKINCIIVDDDPYAIDILKDHIDHTPSLELRSSYTDPAEALIAISTGEVVDLLFLDIDMPGINGLQLATQLQVQAPNIVLTTAYPVYGPESYKVKAKNFLLKPIDRADFLAALALVLPQMTPRSAPQLMPETLFFKTGVSNDLVSVQKHDIVHIRAATNYVDIYLREVCHTVYLTVKELVEKFEDDPHFFRVHRSSIINATHVTAIVGNMAKLGNHSVDMSRRQKIPFLKYVNEHTLLSNR